MTTPIEPGYEYECDRCHHFNTVSLAEITEWYHDKADGEWEMPCMCACCEHMNYEEIHIEEPNDG